MEVLAGLRVPAPDDPRASILTVGDWLVVRISPAASMMVSYAAHVRLYLGPYLGPVLLGELSARPAKGLERSKGAFDQCFAYAAASEPPRVMASRFAGPPA
jgi:hypothetical protein